jgi:thiol-disulfide isomerase/thioredoxin
MKNKKTAGVLIALLMMFALGSGLKAQTSETGGITFFQGTFAEAQAAAKSQGKLIFMDAYTTWCGPCRWMAANTFTDGDVASYFNKNFINVKMDMEKGEGPTLARKYAVNAYPTLLFIDDAGNVKHRALGAKKPDAFVAEGKTAVSKK